MMWGCQRPHGFRRMTSRWQHPRRDFAISLRAEFKSPNSLRLYLGAVDELETRRLSNGGPDDPTAVTRAELTGFMASLTEHWKPYGAAWASGGVPPQGARPGG